MRLFSRCASAGRIVRRYAFFSSGGNRNDTITTHPRHWSHHRLGDRSGNGASLREHRAAGADLRSTAGRARQRLRVGSWPLPLGRKPVRLGPRSLHAPAAVGTGVGPRPLGPDSERPLPLARGPLARRLTDSPIGATAVSAAVALRLLFALWPGRDAVVETKA